MADQKIWQVCYVAGNPAMFTTVTKQSGGAQRRADALKDAEVVAKNGWRVWVEHHATQKRIWESDTETQWRRSQEAKRIIAFAAALPKRAPAPVEPEPVTLVLDKAAVRQAIWELERHNRLDLADAVLAGIGYAWELDDLVSLVRAQVVATEFLKAQGEVAAAAGQALADAVSAAHFKAEAT